MFNPRSFAEPSERDGRDSERSVQARNSTENHGRETEGEGEIQNKPKKQIESEQGGEEKGLSML